jgi:hypothetical protein
MKRAVLLIAAVTLAGCADLTPTQRKTLTVGAAILVTGAIAAREVDQGARTPNVTTPGNPCKANPASCYWMDSPREMV